MPFCSFQRRIASSALGIGWINPRSRVGVTFASRKV